MLLVRKIRTDQIVQPGLGVDQVKSNSHLRDRSHLNKFMLPRLALTLLVSLGGALHNSFAQTPFTAPENIILKTQEDYARYEPSIIESAKWIEETDLDKELDKRQEIIDFVLRWINGTTAITIELTDPVSKLFEKNDLLLGVFLASYASNALGHKGKPDKFEETRAALMAIMTVYKKRIAITKSKTMEKAITMAGQDKLDDYIVQVLKIEKND
jgi:hypothetical protein